MSWGPMFLQGAQGLGSFIAAKRQAKVDKAWQKYNNAMTRIQDAMNQNVLTVNELRAKRRNIQESIQISKSEFATKASIEVSAAASGTTGNSVNMMLFDVTRSANDMRHKSQQDLEDTYLEIDNQRQQSTLGTELQIDIRDLSGPSFLEAALGTGVNMGTTYLKGKNKQNG